MLYIRTCPVPETVKQMDKTIIKNTQKHILLIEEDDTCIMMFESALQTINANYTLEVVHSGSEAIDCLEFSDKVPVHFVVMELIKGNISGLEVIAHIKSHIAYRHIPIIVFSVSNKELEIQAYERYANAFIIKPSDRKQYQNMVQSIWFFWTDIALFPYK